MSDRKNADTFQEFFLFQNPKQKNSASQKKHQIKQAGSKNYKNDVVFCFFSGKRSRIKRKETGKMRRPFEKKRQEILNFVPYRGISSLKRRLRIFKETYFFFLSPHFFYLRILFVSAFFLSFCIRIFLLGVSL